MKLPEEVSRLLAVFRVFGQEMYVVGGAVRDDQLGKPIRDYDLALREADKDIEELKLLADRFGMSLRILSNPQYGGLCVNMKKTGLEIEVMTFKDKTIEERIEEFPVNVSKVYLDADGVVVKHPDFIKYQKTKELVFDFSNAGGTQEQHDAYELKIRRKFA